jgi:hypothetical protein
VPTPGSKEICERLTLYVPLRTAASFFRFAPVSDNTIFHENIAFYMPRSAADQCILREIRGACLDDACVRMIRPENQVGGIINPLFPPCAHNVSVGRRRVLTSDER